MASSTSTKVSDCLNETRCMRRQTLARLASLVGNTPLIEVHYSYCGEPRRIFAKCEQMNLTGSIKDRMALNILEEALCAKAIAPGDTIAEVSSGNTGISFAAIGAALGHKVIIYMPDWMSRERLDIIRSYGAEVVLVSREEGGFLGALRMADEIAERRKDIFLPKQFANAANISAHRDGTGKEIAAQLAKISLLPQAFVAGVGTGGTIMGVGQCLRAVNPAVKVYPVEPAESPVLSKGCKVGTHRIQGISDEFVPAIVDLQQLDKPIAISDGDSIVMAQKLAANLGLAVGISSGCNFLAALAAQNMLGGDSTVVTVFSDDNKKYLSTGLLKQERILPHHLSQNVQLEGFRVLPPAFIR